MTKTLAAYSWILTHAWRLTLTGCLAFVAAGTVHADPQEISGDGAAPLHIHMISGSKEYKSQESLQVFKVNWAHPQPDAPSSEGKGGASSRQRLCCLPQAGCAGSIAATELLVLDEGGHQRAQAQAAANEISDVAIKTGLRLLRVAKTIVPIATSAAR